VSRALALKHIILMDTGSLVALGVLLILVVAVVTTVLRWGRTVPGGGETAKPVGITGTVELQMAPRPLRRGAVVRPDSDQLPLTIGGGNCSYTVVGTTHRQATLDAVRKDLLKRARKGRQYEGREVFLA